MICKPLKSGAGFKQMDIFVSILLIIFVLVVLRNLAQGAVFVPTHQKKVEKIVALARIKAGMKVADLGSGDGRIVMALAQAGAEAHGYEINPLLVWWSRRRIKQAGLASRATIHFKNFWKADFSAYDVVVLFGIDYIMARLEKKLDRELPPHAVVISYLFPFPTWEPSRHDGGILVYNKTNFV